MLDDRVIDHLRDVADLPDLSGTKYEPRGSLASGGMGTVYVVRDTDLGRDVALKVIGVPDPGGELSERLIAEARHLARLEHPNIVPVHDVGRLADGRFFYVMKLVRGKSLEKWGRESHSLPTLLRSFQKICEAVSFAHARGVIHRDLKPDNVMIGPFGEALVMDWGVAKSLDRIAAGEASEDRNPGSPGRPDRRGTAPVRRTIDGAIIGTPAYMAPEQARGEVGRMNERTDVYGLGSILYFLLSGRAPFEAGSPEGTLRRVLEERPVPLRRLKRDVPRALEAICDRALAADPEDRHSSAQELADEIDRFLGGLPVLSHSENLLERAARFVGNNKMLVGLIAAYLAMRLIVLVVTGR